MTGYMPPSETVEWSTPQDLFDKLNSVFKFTVDVAATPENAKVSKFYTEEDNGLEQDWNNEIVWCNPPYGRGLDKWVKKAFEMTGGVCVMLIPARTDTRWFHDYVYGKAQIIFIKGRLKFGGHKNAAPFPNMIVVWRRIG